MVYIESVDLSTRGIVLPSDRVGMVIAQPFLSLTTAEPYQWALNAKPRQMQLIADTLRIAREAHHGVSKTHFTVFPEYSIPGREGVTLVEVALEAADWPSGTIVIGGTDGLTKDDFSILAGEPGTHFDATNNALARMGATEWVNCGITWVKAADGTVERWLQPKLSPAWPELNIKYDEMFRGNSLFAFNGPFDNGTQYRFCSLVCFDWIATDLVKKAWRFVVDELGRQATEIGAELPLSWLFVIQHNRRPSADSFLVEVGGFFDQREIPNVRRDRACLIFANSAGKEVPGKANLYGETSLVFSRQTLFEEPDCHATFCNGGPSFRSTTLLSSYNDILFRERGACIHSFAQVNPNSLSAGAAGKTIALNNAFVFPSPGAADDPRTPAGPVPASVKWLNDELDAIESLGVRYSQAPLAAAVNVEHSKFVNALRVIPSKSVTNSVRMATETSTTDNADEWNLSEKEALEHLLHTLEIMGLAFGSVAVGEGSAHATVVMGDKVVDLLAVRGVTHTGCIEHSKELLTLPRRRVLLISRDLDNNPWRTKDGNFLKPATAKLSSELDITDTGSGSLHLGYRRLLDIFREAVTTGRVQENINAELDR